MNRKLLGSLLALLACAGLARAQAGLGAPIAPNPAVLCPLQPPDCKSRPERPILEGIARRFTTPLRQPTIQLLPPRIEVTPTREEIVRMMEDGSYSPTEIVAAKIKLEEAQAKARRAAVKYLELVDCRYYPEAEAGLIAALRADRSEMVRYEAALALGNSRALTDRMIDALNMSALGLELDNNLAETSEYVRSAARASLARCAARGLCLPPVGDAALGGMDWPPVAIQRVGQMMPAYIPTAFPAGPHQQFMPTSPPIPQPVPTAAILPPVTERERELAATISTPRKAAPESRPLLLFLRNLGSGGETPPASRPQVDPRLRGLAPLGAEGGLAIPVAPAAPYNNNR